MMESTIQKLHFVIQTFSRNDSLLCFAMKRICKELFSKFLMYHKYRLCYLIYRKTTFVLRQLWENLDLMVADLPCVRVLGLQPSLL